MSRSDGDIELCYHPVSCRIHSDFPPFLTGCLLFGNFIFSKYLSSSLCASSGTTSYPNNNNNCLTVFLVFLTITPSVSVNNKKGYMKIINWLYIFQAVRLFIKPPPNRY